MALYEKRRKKPELMLVPLIDVLTMLIFFAFVTMQFKSGAALNITLPKVDTAGKNRVQGLGDHRDRQGRRRWTSTASRPAMMQLEPLLKGRCARSTATSLCSSRPTRATPLKRLAFVMDTCRKIGLNKFSLQAR
jgi:biopolymer transport protein ExbD